MDLKQRRPLVPEDLLRDHPDAVTLLRKTHVAEDTDGRSFVLSDESVDRMGDVVRVSGWSNLDQFAKNPVALFQHRSDFPIGKWSDLRIDKNRKALIGELEFAPAGTSARIDELRALHAAGILRAVSVGFRAIESRPLKTGSGIEFLKQELVECSLCAVPANPNSLAIAKSLVSRDTLDLIFAKPGSAAVTTKRPPATIKQPVERQPSSRGQDHEAGGRADAADRGLVQAGRSPRWCARTFCSARSCASV
jgi:HK97 family phage prohead protease